MRRIDFVASRGWAQHIVDRWRNAVSNRPTSPHTTEIDLSAGESFWRLPRHARAWCLKNLVVVVVVVVVVFDMVLDLMFIIILTLLCL